MLLNLKNVSLNIGRTVLLDRANLTLEAGERLCLLGRNGAGKSTLLKLIAGEQLPDSGEISRTQNLRVSQLPQEVPKDLSGTVYDVVAEGLGEVGKLIAEYHHILEQGAEDLDRLSRVQTALEARDGWALQSRVEAMLTRIQLDGEAQFSGLSGGIKRRTLLARALVAQPDVLLLDEPTNHLDIESIRWLEEFLLGWNGTLLFITHDRAFLRTLATRIVEVDRGTLQSWSGNYDQYLVQKAEAMHAEEKQRAVFDKRLAAEEVWIRRGIQARRTRDQGRVGRLMAMRQQYSARRNLPGQARLVLQEADVSGKLVADAERISFSRGARPIVRDLSTTILRGDKVGIIGPNGAGKTTLLNLLLGKLQPDSGRLKLGTKQEIAYFDQLRGQLNENALVFESIGDGKEFVEINGLRKHVMNYLQDFLFTPDRARSPVRALSGGERSRLLLARLFSVPSNVVVLDEPTNDLDVETLDLLEELLIDYQGTVLLVSHDRDFLDRVATRCLVFEGDGRVGDYVGGYEDWLRQTAPSAPVERAKPVKLAKAGTDRPAPRLNSKEQRELETLPRQIAILEAQQSVLTSKMGDPELYVQRDAAQAAQLKLREIQQELSEAYRRWEILESQPR